MTIPFVSFARALALALLVLGVVADDHDAALALDDLALFAHGFHGRSDFHFFFLLKVYFTENLFFKKIFREESFFFSLSVFALFFACSHNKRLMPQLGARCEKEESFLFYTFRR